MSDRSYVTIMFYDCPPAEWQDIVDTLVRHGINVGETPGTFPVDIVDEEVRLGSLSDACTEIAKDHPKAIFWGQQDAYYEYYGDRCIQVEEGYSWKETDNSGNVPLTAANIMTIAQGCEPQDLEAQLLEAIGHQHMVAALEWREGKRKPQYVIEEMPTLV